MLSEQSFPYRVPRHGASHTRFLVVVQHPILFLHHAYPTVHLPVPLADTPWDRPWFLLFTAGPQLPGRCLVRVRCSLSRCGAPGRRLRGVHLERSTACSGGTSLPAQLYQRLGWERLPRSRGRGCVRDWVRLQSQPAGAAPGQHGDGSPGLSLFPHPLCLVHGELDCLPQARLGVWWSWAQNYRPTDPPPSLPEPGLEIDLRGPVTGPSSDLALGSFLQGSHCLCELACFALFALRTLCFWG